LYLNSLFFENLSLLFSVGNSRKRACDAGLLGGWQTNFRLEVKFCLFFSLLPGNSLEETGSRSTASTTTLFLMAVFKAAIKVW
jgi:hypothetical protein